MGCGASNTAQVKSLDSTPFTFKVNTAWDQAQKSCKKSTKKKLVINRSGWKTVRIFVSSTFRDFHAEREILVKQVFPDLRTWCENRRLHLIECDLRWGVPKDSTTEQTLRICLEEIDRCYQENVWPFFINMTSERTGWVPEEDIIPDYVKHQYDWIDGLSVTEMEIMHAAYRIDNPNALFMFRDAEFLKHLPAAAKSEFTDLESETESRYKLKVLKDKITKKFKERVKTYQVGNVTYDKETNHVEFTGLNDFATKVFDFFKKKIEFQYPMESRGDMNIHARRKEQHESFMKSRSEDVLGRDDIMKEIEEYLYDSTSNVPFLVLGNAGSGKSSILAKTASTASDKILAGDIKPFKNREWRMFCHFVGAVPGSTAIDDMILRLYKEITGNEIKENERSDAIQVVSSLLANDNINPTIIIVDALNQFDNDDDGAKYVTWLPKKLSSGIRIVLSMINGTQQANVLQEREPKPRTLVVSELNSETRTEIVLTLLGKYNKRLDDSQMEALLSKKSSHNPLWLSIACEELRVFGKFREISNKIEVLEDGLLELEVQVLCRFEEENGGNLMIATLCLIEISGMGLLETELLTILGHEEILNLSDEKEEMECSEKPIDHTRKLPAYKWAEVFRALKPFIRPFGDSGEGRLDFYHRSFSKAVRKRYLEKPDGSENIGIKKFWHSLLANFFLSSKNFDRKLEELPIHLVALKRKQDLFGLLSDWPVINKLFDRVYSRKLIDYWRQGASLSEMISNYSNMAENILNNENKTAAEYLESSSLLEILSSLLTQGGEYKFSFELCSKSLYKAQQGKAKDLRLANLYYLSGYILDEKLKLDNYIEVGHKAIIIEILKNFEKAIGIWRSSKDKETRHRLARTLDRCAFHYTSLMEDNEENDYKQKSIDCNQEAISIFRELGDRLMEGDCLTTRSLACVRGHPEQAKFYDQALEMLTQNGGDMNLQVHRLYLNYGIYYEDIRVYSSAYKMFRKWYDLGIELFGVTHPKVKRAIETLNEPIYKNIALRNKDPVPNIRQDVEEEKKT